MSHAVPSVEAAPAPAAETATATEAVARLRQLVEQNRVRLRCVLALEAVGLAVSAPLAYLWLVFFLDSRLHLSLGGRLLASLGLLVGVGWAVRHLLRRWRGRHLSEDQVALAIEQRTPGGVQNRLINAVQLARQAAMASSAMNRAVVEENEHVLRQLHLQQAARFRPAVIRVGLAALLIGVGLGFWLWQPAQFANAAARIFLPLAPIDPLYRTTLIVEPGDVEAAGDVTIRVTIRGERPATLTILKRVRGERSAEVVPAGPGDEPVLFTFRDVTQNVEYAVRGGDFATPFYRITVPRTASFARLHVTYHYPAYTGLPERTLESPGELEALTGTRARLRFVFDEPVDSAVLLLHRPSFGDTRRPLERIGEREFAGEIVLENLLDYRLELTQGGRPAWRQGPFAVRVLKDQAPKLELAGLERRTEVSADAVLPLKITASDDYGLEKVGLFYRPLEKRGEPGASALGGTADWRELRVWPAQRKTTFRQDFDLAVAGLQAAEGERVELALRGADTDPLKKAAWTTGPVFELVMGGEGVALQLQYEQVLRTEEELKALLTAEQKLLGEAALWLRKLDGDGSLRWDDVKNLDALHAAVGALRRDQERTRQASAQTARAMLPQTGNLRIAVSMLADTEMVRAQRILDSVPGRDPIQAKRAALADARLAQERIVRSLEEIRAQYGVFRSDWELGHMIPFAKMLADRQTRLRDQSRGFAGTAAGPVEEFQRRSMSRRQAKVLELCKLIQPAFTGLGTRLKDQEPGIARAFTSEAGTLASEALQQPLHQAAAEAAAGHWTETVRHQAVAADTLAALHRRLREAQAEAARQALAALRARAKSDLEAQKELEKLAPGTAEAFVKDFPSSIKLEDVIRIRQTAGDNNKFPAPDSTKGNPLDSSLLDIDKSTLDLQKDSGVRQDPNILKLATRPDGGGEPNLPPLGTNKVKPFIQEKFADLVGKLLDEAEELTKDYQTLTLSTNQNNNDGGDVGKIGGRINSTGAVAATGNQKPPGLDSGGVSRTGRQGARAHGMVADSDGVDRRGRDKAQEGQEQIADQAGKIKMQKSDDMQRDASTGVGGKKVDADDTHFSLSNAGRWKDDMARRMDKAQRKNYLVERQGGKMDARAAAQLRDLTSKQEQVIERLKAIKKELRNLYLPTEHLDDLAAALEANLESLRDRPDPELFRLQLQTLARLQSAARVFGGATAGLQPSLPRDRIIHGRILDEPAPPALPGYEDAVKDYYLKLANQ
jgi:hypothetical protein